MNQRRPAGRETWRRLLEWDRGQADAERLAARILRMDGFAAIDPSHPLGGPDGLKDVVCRRGEDKWIGAAYFPRGQQSFGQIRDKLTADVEGVEKNGASGIAFVTNQELSLGERGQLAEARPDTALELYHLERIASILDWPPCYGLRLDFLGIAMTAEEQLSYMASRDAELTSMKEKLDSMSALLVERFQEHAPPPDGPTVTPREVRFAYISGNVLKPEYMQCKGCGAMYRVDPGPHAQYVTLSTGSYLSASVSSLTSYLNLQPASEWVVTCPYCGRTQKW